MGINENHVELNFPPYRPISVTTRIPNNSSVGRRANVIDFGSQEDRRRPSTIIDAIRDKINRMNREINIDFRIQVQGLGALLFFVILSLIMMMVKSSNLMTYDKTKNQVLITGAL